VATLPYAALALVHWGPGYRQLVTPGDPALSHPLLAPQVPDWLAGLIFALSLALSALLGAGAARRALLSAREYARLLQRARTRVGSLTDPLHRFALVATDALFVHAGALGYTMLTTDVLKKAVGSPRPNFFALCRFQAGACTTELENAFASFPSGHSSASFASMVRRPRGAVRSRGMLAASHHNSTRPQLLLCHFLGAFLDSPVDVLRRSGPGAGLDAARHVAGAAPLVLALWVAATRVQDYWHSPVDVLAGAALGCVVAHLWLGVCRGTSAASEAQDAAATPPLMRVTVDGAYDPVASDMV
jgi:membrane-associated phospholipid phosphatase